MLRKLKIFRPYGSLGGFSFDLNTGHSNYGGEFQGTGLIEQAKLLRTVYENREDPVGVSETRTEIEYAEQIVFLGFGYHPLNIDLLKANNVVPDLRIYATGFKLPEPARDTYVKRISSVFHKEKTRCDALIKENRITFCNKKSSELLREYGLVMSL